MLEKLGKDTSLSAPQTYSPKGEPTLPERKTIEIEGVIATFEVKSQNDMRRLHQDFEGDYAKEIVTAFKKLHGEGTVVNVGAAQGFYTIYSALCNNPTIAIEPDPPTFATLQRNIQTNGLESKVSCFQYALGEKNEERSLFTDGIEGSASSFLKAEKRPEEVKVVVFRMDQVLRDNPAILVMDVEGYEENVLRGMGNLRPRDIFLEIHPGFLKELNGSEESVRKLLYDYGYVLKGEYIRRNEFLSHYEKQ